MNGGQDRVSSCGVVPRISVIVPTFAETGTLIDHVERIVATGDFKEVILVDASLGDGRVVAQSAFDHFRGNPSVEVLLDAPRGRALQMNTGAAQATGDIFMFVHADTRLPENAAEAVDACLPVDESTDKFGGGAWGRFDVHLDAKGFMYRLIEFMMNLRSKYTGMTTGDQCQFIRRAAFEAVGGYPQQPLMEDIEMSRLLKDKFGLPKIPQSRVTTSARRWQVNGVFRTMVLMWKLRLMYFFGVSPQKLAELYGNARRN